MKEFDFGSIFNMMMDMENIFGDLGGRQGRKKKNKVKRSNMFSQFDEDDDDDPMSILFGMNKKKHKKKD